MIIQQPQKKNYKKQFHKTHHIKTSSGTNKIKLYSYMYCSSTRVFETDLVHWKEQKQFILYIQCKKSATVVSLC